MMKKHNAGNAFYTAFLLFADMADWMDSTADLGFRQHFGYISRWTNPGAWAF